MQQLPKQTPAEIVITAPASTSTQKMHVPVLKNEVLKYLDPKPNKNFIDCTAGQGGHVLEILKANGLHGKILAIEVDPVLSKQLLEKCSTPGFERLNNGLVVVNDSYVHLKEIVKNKKFKDISGILFDLGMSTWHMKESGRGFSFLKDESLDMRYSEQRTVNDEQLTAREIINKWPENEIEKIFKEYGEERFAQRIAKEICVARKQAPIKTTFRLVEIIKKATPPWYHRKKIHPATKTFQALRIAVNDELNNLKKVLPQALEILMPGGKIVIISFHSLEDRIVKNFFREETKKGQAKALTKKPIRPSKEEIKLNPSSRSARLRAIEKKLHSCN